MGTSIVSEWGSYDAGWWVVSGGTAVSLGATPRLALGVAQSRGEEGAEELQNHRGTEDTEGTENCPCMVGSSQGEPAVFLWV